LGLVFLGISAIVLGLIVVHGFHEPNFPSFAVDPPNNISIIDQPAGMCGQRANGWDLSQIAGASLFAEIERDIQNLSSRFVAAHHILAILGNFMVWRIDVPPPRHLSLPALTFIPFDTQSLSTLIAFPGHGSVVDLAFALENVVPI
jgi:hypothetical protein